jgi:hypothetical protein
MSATLMLAPNANASFTTSSGNPYRSDQNGVIANVGTSQDVTDLQAQGCQVISPSPPNLLFTLKGANLNSTADQQLNQTAWAGKFRITKIVITNASVSLSTAAGGFYTGAGKTGTTLVAASQSYSSLTTALLALEATLNAPTTVNASGTSTESGTHERKGLHMKIEAITTCVEYADFLAWSLPLNVRQFDRLIVVTTPNDRHTRDLCEHHHVECLTTDAFHHGGKAFDKGSAISAGLAQLSLDAWVCHIDVDIVLPPRSRSILERLDLDPASLYGIDRMMCHGFAAFAQYQTKPEVQHSCDIYVQASAFPLGVRLAKLHGDGYLPLGFFQLWNAAATGIKDYPSHGTADRGDLVFAQRWQRRNRHLIPEIIGIHIDNVDPDDEMGANWRGRRTKPFLASPEQVERLERIG